MQHKVTEKEYRELLETINGTKTEWDKNKKAYVDEKGASHTFITYNNLLTILKQSMMSGTFLESSLKLANPEETTIIVYKKLKHDPDATMVVKGTALG